MLSNKRKMDDNKENVDSANPVTKKAKTHGASGSFVLSLLGIKAGDFAIGGEASETPIFVCTRDNKVTAVWKGLIEHNFMACPVMTKSTPPKYHAFIDCLDIVRYVVDHFQAVKKHEMLTENRSIWELFEEEKSFKDKTIKDIMTYPLATRNPFHPVLANYSALAVLETLCREEGLHRLPVINNYQERSIINLVTQSQIAQYLWEHVNELSPKKTKKVEESDYFMKDIVSVDIKEHAIRAFELMLEHKITGVAITDQEGKLVGNISARDIMIIGCDAHLFWRLFQPCSAFLDHVKAHAAKAATKADSKEEESGDCAEAAGESKSTHKFRRRQMVTAKKHFTLRQIIEKLATHAVHRVYIVDDQHKPIGVASIRDVLKEVILP